MLRDDLLELNRQIATFNGGDSGGQVELATLFTVSGVHMQPVLAVPGPPAGDKSPPCLLLALPHFRHRTCAAAALMLCLGGSAT